jgi:hypothetical protein
MHDIGAGKSMVSLAVVLLSAAVAAAPARPLPAIPAGTAASSTGCLSPASCLDGHTPTAASPCHNATGPQPVTEIRLHLPAGASQVVHNIADIIVRRIAERSGARVTTDGRAGFDLYLSLEPVLGAEGYAITDLSDRGIKIAGNDERGLLYGVGRFLRISEYCERGFTPGAWRGKSAPECPVRGVYFAVHGNNFYESAPAPEVERYVEDLALWGMNAVACHFPPQQFAGLDDPAALRNIDKIRRLLAAAKRLGLDAGLLEVLNCGFTSAPHDLLYTPFPDGLGRRGHAGVLLCPSRPAGRKYLLDLWAGLLDEFRDIGLDFFVSWPYDEGGCGCESCWPWGAKGFLGLSKDVAELARSKYPASRFILSTWMYDTPPAGEWEGLSRALAADGGWVDAVMADAHEDFPRYPLEHPAPGGKPLLNFPEISMWGQAPWGGYGVNPLPGRFDRLWRQASGRLAGGFPYSEGIFEDINKVICLQFYWDKNRRAMDTFREYASAEFSPAVAEDVAEAIRVFEANHRRDRISQSAVGAAELIAQAEGRLPADVRSGWRWRILALRARIDRELYRHHGRLEGAELQRAFGELTSIYHAENAADAMRPPRLPPQE